ncbi:regulator of MON1-CCZ1 complex-like, partial [Rhincodon typus]|uniref:regulator of MON1-CCZ1 complex-like n=1 Tax=Rhincodon typus TaxID=259920 RepID=UPI00202FE946
MRVEAAVNGRREAEPVVKMMEDSMDDHYLELSDTPVQFEKVSTVNNVFFDEANKQVFAVRSGGATGVVVKGPDDKICISF